MVFTKVGSAKYCQYFYSGAVDGYVLAFIFMLHFSLEVSKACSLIACSNMVKWLQFSSLALPRGEAWS